MTKKAPEHYEAFTLSSALGKVLEWNRWLKEIPFINFPSDWSVKMTPPFAGAIVRFRIRKKQTAEATKLKKDLNISTKEVSVYLDGYDILGSYGAPYWEVYPYNGDTRRVEMDDTDELIKCIGHALEES